MLPSNELLKRSTLFCLSIFFFFITGFTQDGVKVKKEFKAFLNEKQSVLSDSITYYEELKQVATLKYEIAKERYFENQYSEYFTENLKHRKQTFGWQLLSTKWIFVMVVIIVLSGLFFSGIQFYHSVKKSKVKKGELAPGNRVELEKTEMELSLKGIKINSSVIGLIILVVSIAFFYLYILYVYPINQINIDNTNFTKKELKTTS